MLEILIEEIAEILIDTLNNKALRIYRALSLFLYFGIFFFTLLNLILLNLTLLGVPHFYVLSYGLY
jgi:hypothetical protein